MLKPPLLDTSLLFGMPTNTCGSDSGNNDNGNDNNEDKDEDDDDDHDDDNDDAHADASRGHKLHIEDEFLLFMMRLRLGLRVTDLSFRFSISEGTVTSIITTWLNFLFVHLGNILISNMPKDFQEKYSNNVAIIDCTELKIQVPSNLLKRSQSYSTYKSANTLRVLLV